MNVERGTSNGSEAAPNVSEAARTSNGERQVSA
jgi:hypothetical protein